MCYVSVLLRDGYTVYCYSIFVIVMLVTIMVCSFLSFVLCVTVLVVSCVLLSSVHFPQCSECWVYVYQCLCHSCVYYIYRSCICGDRLCGLVIRVPGYTSRDPGFDYQRYQIF
jgi:hypothetical protein